jgi:hypothetical protein
MMSKEPLIQELLALYAVISRIFLFPGGLRRR